MNNRCVYYKLIFSAKKSTVATEIGVQKIHIAISFLWLHAPPALRHCTPAKTENVWCAVVATAHAVAVCSPNAPNKCEQWTPAARDYILCVFLCFIYNRNSANRRRNCRLRWHFFVCVCSLMAQILSSSRWSSWRTMLKCLPDQSSTLLWINDHNRSLHTHPPHSHRHQCQFPSNGFAPNRRSALHHHNRYVMCVHEVFRKFPSKFHIASAHRTFDGNLAATAHLSRASHQAPNSDTLRARAMPWQKPNELCSTNRHAHIRARKHLSLSGSNCFELRPPHTSGCANPIRTRCARSFSITPSSHSRWTRECCSMLRDYADVTEMLFTWRIWYVYATHSNYVRVF